MSPKKSESLPASSSGLLDPPPPLNKVSADGGSAKRKRVPSQEEEDNNESKKGVQIDQIDPVEAKNSYLKISNDEQFKRIVDSSSNDDEKFRMIADLIPGLKSLRLVHKYRTLRNGNTSQSTPAKDGNQTRKLLGTAPTAASATGRKFWQESKIVDKNKDLTVIFTGFMITDKTLVLQPREAAKPNTDSGRWEGSEEWRNNKTVSTGIKIYPQAYQVDIPFETVVRERHQNTCTIARHSYAPGMIREHMIWLNTPSLDGVALNRFQGSPEDSILPNRYCCSIVHYKISVTERLNSLDNTFRNSNKYGSGISDDIRDGSDVVYNYSVAGGSDNKTRLEPKLTLVGYHDLFPVSGVPRVTNNSSIKPDERNTSVIGIDSVFKEQLAKYTKDMVIHASSGEYAAGEYIRVSAHAYGAQDNTTIQALKRRKIMFTNDDDREEVLGKVQEFGTVNQANRMTARFVKYEETHRNIYS